MLSFAGYTQTVADPCWWWTWHHVWLLHNMISLHNRLVTRRVKFKAKQLFHLQKCRSSWHVASVLHFNTERLLYTRCVKTKIVISIHGLFNSHLHSAGRTVHNSSHSLLSDLQQPWPEECLCSCVRMCSKIAGRAGKKNTNDDSAHTNIHCKTFDVKEDGLTHFPHEQEHSVQSLCFSVRVIPPFLKIAEVCQKNIS